ncbi:MAG: InlB B-repeat-containing protein, partial [Methanocorpusculum sp.]|nr:InlB B-repeat-containing protein [Methanocorpusculum sp.]
TNAVVKKAAVFTGASSIAAKAESTINTKTDAAGSMPGDKIGTTKVGVGAGVAVDVTNIETTALVEEIQLVKDSGNVTVKDITVTAQNTGKETMSVSAGSEGGTSVTPVAGVMVTGAYVEAVLGTSDAEYAGYEVKGNILVNALNNMDRSIKADASSAGPGVGIGGTVAVAVINDTVQSILKNDTNSNTIKVNSDNTSKISVNSKAGAKGASTKKTSSSNADQQADAQLNRAADASNGREGRGAGPNQAQAGKNRQKAETSEGKVDVAAAFAVCIQNLISKSTVLDGVTIITFAKAIEEGAGSTPGNTADITAKTESKSDILADASASKSKDGVGVAVAVNTPTSTTESKVGNGNIRTATLSVTSNSKNTANTESASGAGATDVGVAGTVAITVAKIYSQAELRDAANPDDDNIISLIVENNLNNDAESTAASSINPVTGRASKNKDAAKKANSDTTGGNEPHQVTYDQKNPQGTKTKKNLESNDSGKYFLPETVEVPTRDGCVFKGYFDKEKDGKNYYDNTGHRVVADEIKKDITLYAQWTDNRSDVQKEHDKQIEDE